MAKMLPDIWATVTKGCWWMRTEAKAEAGFTLPNVAISGVCNCKSKYIFKIGNVGTDLKTGMNLMSWLTKRTQVTDKHASRKTMCKKTSLTWIFAWGTAMLPNSEWVNVDEKSWTAAAAAANDERVDESALENERTPDESSAQTPTRCDTAAQRSGSIAAAQQHLSWAAVLRRAGPWLKKLNLKKSLFLLKIKLFFYASDSARAISQAIYVCILAFIMHNPYGFGLYWWLWMTFSTYKSSQNQS